MAETEKSLHGTLFGQKTKGNKCKNCDYPLQIYEIDFRKNKKMLKCQRCGLYHYYKKDFVGKWKLQKVINPDLQR